MPSFSVSQQTVGSFRRAFSILKARNGGYNLFSIRFRSFSRRAHGIGEVCCDVGVSTSLLVFRSSFLLPAGGSWRITSNRYACAVCSQCSLGNSSRRRSSVMALGDSRWNRRPALESSPCSHNLSNTSEMNLGRSLYLFSISDYSPNLRRFRTLMILPTRFVSLYPSPCES